jgi:integral membrane protein
MTEISKVRTTGFVEAISAIILFCVAMPLKYFTDMPKAVTYAGSIHGVLWLIYAIVVLIATLKGKLSWGWFVVLAVASFVPFGPFLFDHKLKAMDETDKK